MISKFDLYLQHHSHVTGGF